MPILDPRTDAFVASDRLNFRRAREAAYVRRHGRSGTPQTWGECSFADKLACLAVLAVVLGFCAMLYIPVMVLLSAL
jgi:hypothetical protein